jgi:hypothetical protein
MAPRAEIDPPDQHEIVLSNVANQGLGYYDKNAQLKIVSEANLQLLGT